MSRRKRWMDMLRRSTELVSGGGRAPSLEDAALASVHGRAEAALHQAVQTIEQLVGATSRHRAAIDALVDRQRAVATRVADARAAMTRLSDAHARLSVVALNAGLEGARVEGAAGRALVLVADEVRSLLGRAAASSSELQAGLEEAAGESSRLEAQIGEARASSGRLADEATGALGGAHEAEAKLSELGGTLRRATGLDAELAAAVESAQSHARELVAALTVVSSRAQASVAAAALRPILEPLARLLDQLVDAATEPEEAG